MLNEPTKKSNWDGEADRQEKELKEEGKRLSQLQGSIHQTTILCQDLIRQLDRFEDRVAALQPTIMPLYRNLSTISRVHANVQLTLDVVKTLAEKNELARREEYLLANGPSAENLDAYLGGIVRIDGALQEMRENNLTFCEVTLRRLESTNRVALDLLTSKYKEWLIEASNLATASTSDTMPIFAIESTTTNTPRTIPSISIPSELAHRLMRIATFAANLSSTRQMSPSHSPSELPLLITILGYYAEVRSLHLINRLTPLFRASSGDYSGNVPISTVGGGYQRGTHPLIRALQEFFGLAQAEGHFALLVLPSTVYNPSVSSSVASEGVRKALKHPSDLVRMTSEAIATRVGKAVIRGEFAEWVWIFDVVEVFNDLWVNAGTSQEGIMSTTVSEEEVALAIKSMEGVKEMILPALKAVTSAALQFLHRLVDNINSPPVTGVTGSANATVYEGTSMLLNCLKKMLEYERIIEALLRRWAQVAREESSAAEGMEEFIVGPLPSASAAEAGTTEAMVFSMALYYQDLLKGLEVTIERTSRDYRKAIIGILFQLNNFHYILRTIHSTPALADLITTESEQKYQLIEETLLKEYLNYWRTCASLMSDGGRGSSLSPKDRLKTFASELEELVRGQEACAVPDAELRIRLINFVREIVVPSFTTFYNMNQSLFQAYTKIKLDPTSVEIMFSRLFQA